LSETSARYQAEVHRARHHDEADENGPDNGPYSEPVVELLLLDVVPGDFLQLFSRFFYVLYLSQ